MSRLEGAKWWSAAFVILSCSLAVASSNGRMDDMPLVQRVSARHVVAFERDGVRVVGADHVLKTEFVSASSGAAMFDPRPSSEGQPSPSGEVVYDNVWPGISVTYRQPAGGIVKSTYRLEPGADVNRIRLCYNVPVRLDDSGALLFEFETGQMRESAPVAWQEVASLRVPVEVSFRLLSDREVGFALGEHDPAYQIIIDPTLIWNTFLGSETEDQGFGIAVDGTGVYVTGTSETSWGSPVRAHAGREDAFAAKVGKDGTLL